MEGSRRLSRDARVSREAGVPVADPWVRAVGGRPEPSADLLRQLDDDPLRTTDVAEPIAVLVALQLANELRAAGSQASVDGVDGVDRGYGPGQEWLSIGAWLNPYPWNNAGQQDYVREVQQYLRDRVWEQPEFHNA